VRSGSVWSPYTALTICVIAAMARTAASRHAPGEASDVGAMHRGQHMPKHRSRGASAVVGTVLLLALVIAGCGRRGLPAAAGSGSDGGLASPTAASTGSTSSPPVETATPSPTVATTSPPPAIEPPGPAPEPTPAPLAPIVPPDLTAIEQLLADLDAALGADATADSEEGSTP